MRAGQQNIFFDGRLYFHRQRPPGMIQRDSHVMDLARPIFVVPKSRQFIATTPLTWKVVPDCQFTELF